MSIASEVLHALLLSDFLDGLVLELGEVARVLENLDESVLVKCLLGCLGDGANGIDCSLEETLLVKIGGVDRGQVLLVVLGLGLLLLNGGVLDGDGLTHICLITLSFSIGEVV